MNLRPAILFRICGPALLIYVLLIFSGCDALSSSDDEINLEPGTFKVQVEGHVNQSFQGNAVFETKGTGLGFYFALVLQYIDTEGNYTTVEFRRKRKFANDWLPLQPGTGSHRLVNYQKPPEQRDSDKYSGYYSPDIEDVNGRFHSAGGTLSVTASKNDVMKGSFDFPGYGSVDLGQGESKEVEVHISGEFHAVPGEAVGDIF